MQACITPNIPHQRYAIHRDFPQKNRKSTPLVSRSPTANRQEVDQKLAKMGVSWRG
ncbi:hypothetical protein CCP4SC76_2290003 [Gammaproteobacteria bacterium]